MTTGPHDPEQYIRIEPLPAGVDIKEGADDGSRLLTFTRPGDPVEAVLGIEITSRGTIIVGHWPDGETWERLHTDVAD